MRTWGHRPSRTSPSRCGCIGCSSSPGRRSPRCTSRERRRSERQDVPCPSRGVQRTASWLGRGGKVPWRWDWVREVRELVFALDADAAGQQQWRQLARQAALRGKRVAVLPAAAYGGYKDVNEAWAAGVLAVGVGPAAATVGGEVLATPQHLRET